MISYGNELPYPATPVDSFWIEHRTSISVRPSKRRARIRKVRRRRRISRKLVQLERVSQAQDINRRKSLLGRRNETSGTSVLGGSASSVKLMLANHVINTAWSDPQKASRLRLITRSLLEGQVKDAAFALAQSGGHSPSLAFQDPRHQFIH